jgi:hypothetical protein
MITGCRCTQIILIERGGILISDQDYIRHSLETNLFYLRLVKEHTIFAAASLPPRDAPIMQQLLTFKNNFEALLSNTVTLSKGIINPEVSSRGEFVTDLTLEAEKATQMLTGIPIDTDITRREMGLNNPMYPMDRFDSSPAAQMNQGNGLLQKVSALNQAAILGATAAIKFKITLLNNILNCRSFSYTYPTMLDHVIRET